MPGVNRAILLERKRTFMCMFWNDLVLETSLFKSYLHQKKLLISTHHNQFTPYPKYKKDRHDYGPKLR